MVEVERFYRTGHATKASGNGRRRTFTFGSCAFATTRSSSAAPRHGSATPANSCSCYSRCLDRASAGDSTCDDGPRACNWQLLTASSVSVGISIDRVPSDNCGKGCQQRGPGDGRHWIFTDDSLDYVTSPAEARIGNESAGGQEVQQRVMEISPPEELAAGLAIPATWSQATGMSTSLEPLRLRTPGRSALFEQGELDRLQRLQARSSLLLGASTQPAQQSDGNSTSSSANLQAEVQRQLEEYGQRQKLEMQRLQQEIFNLRAERDALQEGKRLSGVDASTIRPQSGVASSQPEGRAVDLPGHPQVSAPQGVPGGQVAKAAGVSGLWGLASVPAGQPSSSPLPRLATLFEGQGIYGGNGRTADVPGHPQVSAPSEPHGGNVRTAAGIAQSVSGFGCLQGSQSPGSMPYPKTMPQSFGPLPSEGVERASSARGRQPVVESQGVSGNLPKAAPPSSTPSQWLGQAAPGQAGDPLSLLVGGITQLQAAMMKQYDGDASPEAVKPGTSTLPTLKPVESTTSSVELQDWMEMIAPAMADLSNSSAQWWTKVRTLAEETYALWSRASPLQRLNVQPPLGTDLESGKWARVNARGASMLMSAVDQSVGAELVARRLTQSCPGIIFRLMTLYQPGGEQEKGLVLQHLQAPPTASTAATAVESLRTWARWMRRSEAINLTKPDPTILTRGLTTITQGVLATDYQANFRTSLVRNSLSVDVSPTYQTVEAYHKHLLAEMEALASGTSATTATSLTSPTKLKELRAAQGHQPGTPSSTATMSPASPTLSDEKERMAKRAATLCRYFGKTQKGCVRGAKCPFKHSWDGMESKDRCLACGGKGHLAKECPTKKNAAAKSTPRAPSATPDPAARSVRVDEAKNQVVEVPAATSTAIPAATSSASSQASELREVLNEAGKMLKALSAAQAKACKVVNPLEDRIYQFDEVSMAVEKRVKGIEEESMGLLDSGASHPLKPGNG